MTSGPDTAHPDQRALDRIAHALDETLFVVAGAGSGKTRALVTRLRNLVTDGKVPLRSIAAITFTEKAATELRARARAELTRAAAAGDVTAAAALDELDGAAIGTLHSFAHRLLNEHPVEAGLPPRVEVLDEVSSAVAFEDRWARFLDRLIDDDSFADPLLVLTACGVKPDALKEIAFSFNQNWDLVEAATFAAGPTVDLQDRLDAILADVDAACARRRDCRDGDDTLHRLLDTYADWCEQVRLAPDETARLELLQPGEGTRPTFSPNGKGAKTRWAPGVDLPALRSDIQAVRDACDELVNDVAHDALLTVAAELRQFTLDAAEERRREGRLEFHDLLVLARTLLRDPRHGPDVRRVLRDRYRRLLIDEFQDTDPIQVDLAVLLAAADPDTVDRDWSEVKTENGRLFFVGDPKQSIYRFRRADIDLYLRAAERFGGPTATGSGQRLTLGANHRSGPRLIEWLNTTFADMMRRPLYTPSVSRRTDAPAGPGVAVIGRSAHTDRPRADDLRRREAADVAASVGQALADEWPVERSNGPAGPVWVPARAGDIAVLLPNRLPLPFLEDALTDAAIPFRTESASLVYGSRMVRDLFTTLRAVDDPSDELTIVTALRSPLFGCGDDDLLTFREHHRGRFDHSLPRAAEVPADHPVARSLEYLRELHGRRHWMAPSEILGAIIRDRRVFELAAAEPRGRARDLWHRIRFVEDQARAWSDATGGTLRQYLEWVRRQAGPGARVAEAVLPETDDDAVRIMTIHAAKGLEFPITIVAGLSTQPHSRRAGGHAAWQADGTCILSVGARVRSPAYEVWRPVDEQMAHDERIRLLYVACSRARDHLVVSLHRADRARAVTEEARMTGAELLVRAMGDTLARLPDGTPDGRVPAPAPTRTVVEKESDALPSFGAWESDRAEALRRAGTPRTVAATNLDQEGRPDGDPDPGLQKRPRDLDLPPWRKGRYGTAIGRAVHGALQVIDLAAGNEASVEPAVAAQVAAEGIAGRAGEERVDHLVRAALAAPAVVEAGQAAHWKEVHVAVPLPDGRLLEGYVDLLYRRPDGRLVVVDYKTGPDRPDDDTAALVDHYRMQGASYAMALGDATGEEVADVIFVFLTPDGPVQHSLPALSAAIDDARARLAGHGPSSPVSDRR